MEVTNEQVALQIEKFTPWIKHLTSRTVRKCRDPIYDRYEIEERLKVAVWKAMSSWREDGGASLSSWIFRITQQVASQVVTSQSRYNRDYNNIPFGTVSLDAVLPKDPMVEKEEFEDIIDKFQLEDSSAATPLVALEWQELITLVRQIMEEGQEQKIYDEIVSGEHRKDKEVADKLQLNFQKVGTVRLKMKLAFAWLYDIPLQEVTSNQKAKVIMQRIVHKLARSETWNY